MSHNPTDRCTRCGGTGHSLSECKWPKPGVKPGTYLGGVIDRKSLLDRCCVEDGTDCWVWKGAFTDKSPKVTLRIDGKHTALRGKSAAWFIKTGERVPQGMYAFATENCQRTDCVNPEHSRIGTYAQWGKWIAGRGIFKGQPARVKANRETARKMRKLTPEQVREIRESPESTYTLAKRFGVSQNTVWDVRVFKAHASVGAQEMAGASVFTWRPAA